MLEQKITMSKNLNSLCCDPAWMKQMEAKDPLFDRIRSYYLPGKSLKPDVECASKICKLEFRTAIASVRSETSLLGSVSTLPCANPMMLCFACNRVFHLKCVDLTLVKLKEEKVPWRCIDCKQEEFHDAADNFYTGGGWKRGLSERKKALLTVGAFTQHPELLTAQATDDEFDREDEDSFCEHENNFMPISSYNQQREEMTTLANELESVVRENEKLKQSLDNMKDLKEQLKGFETMKSQVEALEKKLKNVSIETKDAANTNASSTLPSFNVTSSTMYVPKVISAKDILSRLYLEKGTTCVNANGVPANPQTSNAAPMQQGSTSFFDSVDKSQLNVSELVLLEQVNTQKEATQSRKGMTEVMMLEQIRKSMPKMSKFTGDPKEWITFKRDVKRYQEIGKYDEGMMKMYILQALSGVALERVRDMIDQASLSHTLSMLEEDFGEASSIIDRCGDDILAMKLSKELHKQDVMAVCTKIQAYFTACSYAGESYANTNHLAKHIFEQLGIHHREMYRQHHLENNPENPNKLMNLEVMFTFLEKLKKILGDRKFDDKDKKAKSAQVMSGSASVVANAYSNSTTENNYVIMDLQSAKFMGYDMNLVNKIPKHCECCRKNDHYTVECKRYQSMDGSKRLTFANEKRLCRNCMISTDHRAVICEVKPSCGLKVNGVRCTQKHHVSLHKVLTGKSNFKDQRYRRGHSQQNSSRAQQIYNASSASAAATSQTSNSTEPSAVINSAPTIQQIGHRAGSTPRTNQVIAAVTQAQSINVVPYESRQTLNVSTNDYQRTVKVFKNKFLGNEGYVVGYSIGDSAAEVTLMRDDLRKALKLEGEPCTLELQWTDSTKKTVNAIRVDLEVKGVHKRAKKLILRNCFAVEDFDLPPRSLNIHELKKKFPYLHPVKFESYENAVPMLLIGSPHASVFESCGELLEGGEGKPVGLLAKLGWCVYGGCPDEMNKAIVSAQNMSTMEQNDDQTQFVSNEQLFELYTFFNSIENMGVREKSSNYTDDENKAVEIMEEELRVLPNGSIEVPLVWNRDQKAIPTLPNNFNMVYKRQLTQESRFLKTPEHHQVYNNKFKELISEGYVRAATTEDFNGDWPNVNYLPMSLVINANKIPVGYRIVFDAAAKYQGASLNSCLLKGPDLLIDLITPLVHMRTKQVAFTADIKAMFMRMKINIRDQQCQRVLWREKPEDDMRVFIVSSMLFGPSCSPFQSQYVKNKVAEAWRENYPHASETIVERMYMDDIITSEATVEDAIAVSTQCIEIFDSINWRLISFQSNNLQLLKSLPGDNVKQEVIPVLYHEGSWMHVGHETRLFHIFFQQKFIH